MSEHALRRRDMEAAAEFDENELDNLRPERAGVPRYSLGDVSSDGEEDHQHKDDIDGGAAAKQA